MSKFVNTDVWSNRKKSLLVKKLMLAAGKKPDDINKYLKVSVTQYNNKLTRNSFSFENLIIIAYVCGYRFRLVPTAEECTCYDIDLEDYFQGYDEDVIERVHELDSIKREEARAEYEQKKRELEQFASKYGFDK